MHINFEEMRHSWWPRSKGTRFRNVSDYAVSALNHLIHVLAHFLLDIYIANFNLNVTSSYCESKKDSCYRESSFLRFLRYISSKCIANESTSQVWNYFSFSLHILRKRIQSYYVLIPTLFFYSYICGNTLGVKVVLRIRASLIEC